jgi:DNA-binding transcriptional LysR family regulator
VKAAARELDVSEAAVSMHVAQLRREFDDLLFTRASSGLAFTPGGLRLASRAVEILGLQDRTAREVSQAGRGLRVLRLACTSLFAEHAAPGLIDLFAARADDLEVELSVRPVDQLPALLLARAADVAVGPVGPPRDDVAAISFLRYEVVAAARPGHPLAGHPVTGAEVRRATWALGPAAVGTAGVVPTVLRRLGVPEKHQRIFQSQAAATEETKGSDAVTLAVRFAIGADVSARRLSILEGPGLRAQGSWSAMALPKHSQIPVAAELMRFITSPRATQAMVKGAGVELGRFKPTIHVTLWS